MALTGPIQPHAYRLRRGGPNNPRDRETWQLSEHDCRKIIAASYAAWEARVPFTRFATLAWGLGEIDPRHCAAMTASFLDRVRDWLDHRGHGLSWAAVQECGAVLGAHSHVLFHVPWDLDKEFRPWPLRWAKSLLAGRYTTGVVDCQSLFWRAAAYSNPPVYWASVNRKLQYMLKCGPAELEQELGLRGWGDKPWGQRCKTYGKRAGVWQFHGKGCSPSAVSQCFKQASCQMISENLGGRLGMALHANLPDRLQPR